MVVSKLLAISIFFGSIYYAASSSLLSESDGSFSLIFLEVSNICSDWQLTMPIEFLKALRTLGFVGVTGL